MNHQVLTTGIDRCVWQLFLRIDILSLGDEGNYKGQFLMSKNKSAVFHSRLVFLQNFVSNTKFSILALFHRSVNFLYLRFQSVFADMISLSTSLTSRHYTNNGSEWKKPSLVGFESHSAFCICSVCMCLHWRSCKYKCASRQLFLKSFRSI